MTTIFAPIMPPIKAAISIIRISGVRAGDILQQLTGGPLPKPRYAARRMLRSPLDQRPIDYALVLWFPAPHSFTGDDVVELHLHGSRAVTRHCLSVLDQMEGLRYAEPGEFSKRAFENGKMDLTEAEGLADLIEAETLAQSTQALYQMHGGLKQYYEAWRKELIDLMAQIEAYIDFPDEDIPADIAAQCEATVADMITAIRHHLNDNRKGELLRTGLSVAIIGAPNAGKSTLLNQLSQRDVAIVSEYAGTTRDILEVHLDIAGFPFILADTAGLRESKDTIEQEGIRRAHHRAEQADILLAVFDGTSPILDPATKTTLNARSIALINKADDPKSSDATLQSLSSALNALTQHPAIILSAKTGEGIPALLAYLKSYAQEHFGTVHRQDPLITRARHRTLLTETLLHLEACHLSSPMELYAEHIRRAAISLGKITGHIDVEEVLDSLFRQFCIGK